MWCRPTGNRANRFGFTAYALRLMQDVYFLDWSVNVGDALALKQQIGNIETSRPCPTCSPRSVGRCPRSTPTC